MKESKRDNCAVLTRRRLWRTGFACSMLESEEDWSRHAEVGGEKRRDNAGKEWRTRKNED